MRRPLSRLVAVLAGGLLAAASIAPLAAAAETAENVQNLDESWYLNRKEPLAAVPGGDPTCNLGACNGSGQVVRPNTPRPENTLQVSALGGEPDASTAFTFDLANIPFDAVVTGGTTTLTVLNSREAGTFNPDQADMSACLTTGFLVSSQDGASFNDRPEFDCTTSAPLVRTDGDVLAYTIDLSPFAQQWASGVANNGLSIVPSEKARAERRTFGIAFAGKRNENGVPATSTLQYEVQDSGFGTTTPTEQPTTTAPAEPAPPAPPASSGGTFDSGAPVTTDSGFTGGGGFTSDTGTVDSGSTSFDSGGDSFGTVSSPEVADSPDLSTTTDTAVPVEAPPAVTGDELAFEESVPTAATPAEPASSGTNLAYWLLPLLGLGLAGTLGYSLTQPVELPAARQGAVSKLMTRRRADSAASV
jgi:hypothetical protein